MIQTEKPQLDSQLTLSILAKQMSLNTTVLSRVVNSGFGINFNDIINKFRIGEVKNKLNDGAAENLNWLNIAFIPVLISK